MPYFDGPDRVRYTFHCGPNDSGIRRGGRAPAADEPAGPRLSRGARQAPGHPSPVVEQDAPEGPASGPRKES